MLHTICVFNTQCLHRDDKSAYAMLDLDCNFGTDGSTCLKILMCALLRFDFQVA